MTFLTFPQYTVINYSQKKREERRIKNRLFPFSFRSVIRLVKFATLKHLSTSFCVAKVTINLPVSVFSISDFFFGHSTFFKGAISLRLQGTYVLFFL